MRLLVLVLLVGLISVSPAFGFEPVTVAQTANGGMIGVYADPGGADCNLVDAIPGLCTYYVMHMYAPAVTASQFMIVSEHLGIFLSEISPFFVVIGTSATGIQIAYGACLASPIHILTLNYFCQGITPPCATMSVVGHPTAEPPGLFAADCDYNLVRACGLTSPINGDGSCPCVDDLPSGVEPATWGHVKAMFR